MRSLRPLLISLLSLTLLASASAAQTSSPGSEASASPSPGGSPAASPGPTGSPGPTDSPDPGGALVSGSGEALCPWGGELPAGSDVMTGQDNTTNARGFVFDAVPEDLDAAERLQASWSAYAGGAMGPISPGCSVYLFEDADIDDIWDWFASTYAERSAPAPTEEPVPPGAPGEDGRLFRFPPSFDRESWTYVFKLRNVIAAASLDADVGSASSDDVIGIAEALAGRIEAAADGEPMPAAPSPTPEPSFPTEAEAELLEHVPPTFQETCVRTTFARSDLALAAVTCGVEVGGGSVTVTYQQLADAPSVAAVYESTLSFLGIQPDTGPCGGEWPAEGSYTLAGEEAGRVACATLGDLAAIISWTDDRLLIHGYAEGFDVGREALFGWWAQESGPVVPAENGAADPSPGG